MHRFWTGSQSRDPHGHGNEACDLKGADANCPGYYARRFFDKDHYNHDHDISPSYFLLLALRHVGPQMGASALRKSAILDLFALQCAVHNLGRDRLVSHSEGHGSSGISRD